MFELLTLTCWKTGLIELQTEDWGRRVETCQESLLALRVPTAGTLVVNKCRPTSAADLAGAFILTLLITGI